jgi:hypothetical protein
LITGSRKLFLFSFILWFWFFYWYKRTILIFIFCRRRSYSISQKFFQIPFCRFFLLSIFTFIDFNIEFLLFRFIFWQCDYLFKLTFYLIKFIGWKLNYRFWIIRLIYIFTCNYCLKRLYKTIDITLSIIFLLFK